MPKASIYARYSTDEQRATSIDDQVRRAKEKALALGYEVPDHLIFSDSAVTGQESGIAKRLGYSSLLTAWDKREFQALFIDELSRLDRENFGLAFLQNKVEKSGVRFVSTDGIDSDVLGWQLNFGFRGVMASHAIRETGHRVVRAMLGQLERGFMIAAPPFGYRLQRAENDAGTHWVKHESELTLVKDIFNQRRRGNSFSAIALSLNERGIASPRPSRKDDTPRYWRPATVRQLLRNTIYRGVFVWNGSDYSKAKAKRNNKELKEKEYPRPLLRIVDDDVWFECNKSVTQQAFYGGGKSIFAGILSCGTCHANLTIANGGSSPCAYCAQCAQAKRVGVMNRASHYVSLTGVKKVLVYAMEKLFSDAVMSDFREMLRAKLDSGQKGKIIELKRDIAIKERASARYLTLLGATEVDDPILTKNYKETAQERARLCSELKEIELGISRQDRASIERQLAVNPLNLLPKLFEDNLPVERVKAIIRRLFPVIKLVRKSGKFTTVFYIEVTPGALFAEISDTPIIEGKQISMTLQVIGGAERPCNWVVSQVN